MATDAIVIGAGVSGLVCALELTRLGFSAQVLEAADAVGGRVRTDVVDGFRLDRGFQVLLTAYPEARRWLNYEGLHLHAFEPGAIVNLDGRFHRLSDPMRRPAQVLSTALAPIGSFRDKFLIAQLREELVRADIDEVLTAPESSTNDYLQEYGFSQRFIESFFRPFFGGIFLDSRLDTSNRMFRFVFRMFSLGFAALPAEGMQAIPNQLASALPDGCVRLHAKVASVDSNKVRLDTGEELTARALVIGCDPANAARLIGSGEAAIRRQMRPVSCFYFAAEDTPIDVPYLMLNGDGSGPINNVCVPSVVAPSYAPDGMHLVSVTVLQPVADESSALGEVRAQLREWFGPAAQDWKHLRTYSIEDALPDQSLGCGGVKQSPVRLQEGLYVCGDHRASASLNGAMLTGRRAAEAAATDFGVTANPA